MIANIIGTFFIVGYLVFCIWYIVHSHIKAKKDNIPAGCFSCAAFKTGKCHHCGCNAINPR